MEHDVLVDKMLGLAGEEGLVDEAILLIHLASEGQRGVSLPDLLARLPEPTEIDRGANSE